MRRIARARRAPRARARPRAQRRIRAPPRATVRRRRRRTTRARGELPPVPPAFFFGAPAVATSFRTRVAVSRASLAGHAPAATPRASAVKRLDAAWLFPPAPARRALSCVSSAHRTCAVVTGSPLAAAKRAAPKVRSVASSPRGSASSAASAAFAAPSRSRGSRRR